MSTRRKLRDRSHRWFVFSVVAVGLTLGLASWILQDPAPWWSNALINAGVVILLLVPGDLALRKIGDRIVRVEGKAQQAKETSESAALTANRVEQSLEDVREALFSRQEAEHTAELGVYREFVTNLSRASLWTALNQATQDDLITSKGVRSPVWWTTLHYRFLAGGSVSDPVLEVALELDDGTVLSTHRWEQDVRPEAFLQQLVEAVRAAGQDLGLKLNDPTESIEQLSDMLVEVVGLRSQELAGYRQTLRSIIERVDGWYFTEEYVLPKDRLKHGVAIGRLNDMDWGEHFRRKGLYEAEDQFEFARRLYGVEQK